MAYGPWRSAQPVGNGAYRFDRAGQPVTLIGPEAADLARRVAASNAAPQASLPALPGPSGAGPAAAPAPPRAAIDLPALRTQALEQSGVAGMPDERLASAGGMPYPGRNDSTPERHAANLAWMANRDRVNAEQQSRVDARQALVGGRQNRTRAQADAAFAQLHPERAAAATAPPAAAAGPPAPAAPPASAAAPPQQAAPEWVNLASDENGIQLQIREGDDPKRPGALRRVKIIPGSAASKGGLVEQGRTVQEGPGYNQEYIDSLQNAAIDENTRIDESTAGLQADADQRKAILSQQAIDNQKILEDSAAYLKERQVKTEELEKKTAEAQQTYKDSKVDPTRASGGIFDAVGVALGAFGAALAKTPNFAMEIMQNRINNDIRAQEKEIEVRGKNADNQLARFRESLGDMGLAKKAYEIAALNERQTQMDLIGANSKSREVKANVEAAKALNMKNLAEKTESYRIAMADEVTKQMKNTPARAAQKARVEVSSPTLGEISGAQKVLNPEGDTDKEQDKNQDAAKATYAQFVDFVRENGGEIDQATGEITKEPNLPVDVPLAGDTSTTSNVKQDLSSLGVAYANVINQGREVSERTKEKLTPQIGPLDAPQGQLKAMARNLAVQVQQGEKKKN